MNFLELVQNVSRESGVVSGVVPSTVIAQDGQRLEIVKWTEQAWVLIQDIHKNWRWMQKDLILANTQTTAGAGKYTPASFSVTDMRDWSRDNQATGFRPYSIYKTATGVSDENTLREISFEQWVNVYGRQSQTNNRPYNYAISPAKEFCLGPIPDDTFTIRGPYSQAAVRMTANADIPGLPDGYHEIIVWRAIMLLGEFDDSVRKRDWAELKYRELLDVLELDQLQEIYVAAEPLA